ncbi:MarC family protein [Pseudomaricurvus sp. HS19]|uniref:MarC family protein n=1 Tax=Pseudomaricurvus sp. HS19 TaxID=2692626 RepID=UPI00136D8F54|nr:MarC family protein [Pseudomaricurvus sp. HS19]MYM64220.1 NAAT family transporter [Pseudomaricurvus sp. HS19]
MIDYVATFIYFFAVIDPIGTIPVFLAVTSQHQAGERAKIALLAFLVSLAVLLFFIVAGEIILTAMKIPLSAFQVAGGIVLFLFALTMIFGEGKPEQEMKLVRGGNETAIFPLAVPSIASPGAMLAAVLMTENSRYSLWEQAQTAATMVAVLLVALVLMLGANFVHRLIGASGASIISRVMGLILASVATANTMAGIKDYFAV